MLNTRVTGFQAGDQCGLCTRVHGRVQIDTP